MTQETLAQVRKLAFEHGYKHALNIQRIGKT